MNLFGYISGKNEAEQNEGKTTSVFSQLNKEQMEMSVVLPEEVARQGAPKGNDQRSTVSKREAGRIAVYRYSGGWTKEREQEARETLAK